MQNRKIVHDQITGMNSISYTHPNTLPLQHKKKNQKVNYTNMNTQCACNIIKIIIIIIITKTHIDIFVSINCLATVINK